MYTAQLTSLAFAAFSTIVNAKPVLPVNPGGPEISATSTVTIPTVSGIHGLPPSLSSGKAAMPTSSLVPSASFKMSGTDSCTISVSNMPECDSGTATMSKKVACSKMKKHHSGVTNTLICENSDSTLATTKRSVGAEVRLSHEKNGTMVFEYAQGGFGEKKKHHKATGTGIATPTATMVAPIETVDFPEATPVIGTPINDQGVVDREVKPRIITESYRCKCSMADTAEECSSVNCWTKAVQVVVNDGKGPQPDVV